MLVCRSLKEQLITSLAFKAFSPVVCGVHVLVAESVSSKHSRAGLTFRPVAIVVHVILTVVLIPEVRRTCFALKHPEKGLWKKGMAWALGDVHEQS